MTSLERKTLDRYEVQRLIGKGGMANVYLGYDPNFNREVAIKVFKREDNDLLKRFVREARLMASLHHPHLMPVYDTGEAKLYGVTRYYIVMPFMRGGTLRSLIKHGGPISPQDAAVYLREIAGALDYMHARGIIHRDIKSSNVLLNTDGHCYLADFGIARETGDTQHTSTGHVLGTVDYIAPELFEADGKASPLSDLYALGVLLFEMVTGEMPFVSENQLAVVAMHATQPPPSPRSFVPSISPEVEAVILKALEKKPVMRYRSAGELAEAFSNAVAGVSVSVASTVERNGSAVSAAVAEREGPLTLFPRLDEKSPVRGPSSPSRQNVYQQSARRTPLSNAQLFATAPTQSIRPTQKRHVLMSLVSLALLLIIGIPVIYTLFAHNFIMSDPVSHAGTSSTTSKASQSPAATKDTSAQATATAQAKNAKATAVAAAGATATVQAQASATPGVFQTAIAGAGAYDDPLTNANSAATKAAHWNGDTCTFMSDGYHETANSDPVFGNSAFDTCRETGRAFSNFAATVDISIKTGNSGGLLFRVNDAGSFLSPGYSGYLFEVDSVGNYKISRSNNFSSGDGNVTLQNWAPSPALKTGYGATNTLQVLARNGELLFYINGTFIPKVFQDTTFTSGNLALLATTNPDNTSTEVVYSNMRVTSLN